MTTKSEQNVKYHCDNNIICYCHNDISRYILCKMKNSKLDVVKPCRKHLRFRETHSPNFKVLTKGNLQHNSLIREARIKGMAFYGSLRQLISRFHCICISYKLKNYISYLL